MNYHVRIIEVAQDMEEEVVVEVLGRRLTCFASVCPHAILPGGLYSADFSLWAANGLELRETNEEEDFGLTQLGEGFRYRVVGLLDGAVLDAGIQFEDEAFTAEYGFLTKHKVVTEVDRIQIAFVGPANSDDIEYQLTTRKNPQPKNRNHVE